MTRIASAVDVQNQLIELEVPVAKTPVSLVYRSDHAPGFRDSSSLEIPLTGDDVPDALDRVELEVSIADQTFERTFSPEPNQTHTLYWDRLDGAERQQTYPYTVRLGYTYGRGATKGDTVWNEATGVLEVATGAVATGWSIDIRHEYDHSSGVLRTGTGDRWTVDTARDAAAVALPAGIATESASYLVPARRGDLVFVFDDTGRHLATIDSYAGTPLYRFSYDNLGLRSITDADGNTTTLERDADGVLAAIRSPYGRTTTLTIDGGTLRRVSGPADGTLHFEYGDRGLMTALTDAEEQTATFEYEDSGRLAAITGPAGRTANITRERNGRRIETRQITAEFREFGYLYEELPGGGERRVTTCCATNETVSVSGADTAGREDTFPDGTVITSREVPDARFGADVSRVAEVSIELPSGLAVDASATHAGEFEDETGPLGPERLVETIEINDRTYTQTFDRDRGEFVNSSPEGRQSATRLETSGRLGGIDVDGISSITFDHDETGRLVESTFGSGPEARTVQCEYDDFGELVALTDPVGRTREFEYDDAGNVVALTLPGGRTVEYEYDGNGNVVGISPPGRPTHRFEYTAADAQAKHVPPGAEPGAGQTEYVYDGDGLLTAFVDGSGEKHEITYDEAGRPWSISIARGRLEYAYDGETDLLKAITTPEGDTVTYEYDGELLTGTTWSGTVEGSVRRTYDHDLRVAARTVNDDHRVSRSYDDDGLVVEAGDLRLRRDDRNGLLEGTTLDGVSTSIEYNEFGEPVSYTARHDGVLYTTECTYDRAGRITEMSERLDGEERTVEYEYDRAGRLARVREDDTVRSYEYDENGNRTGFESPDESLTARYDERDRLITYGDISYTYDDAGRLQRKSREEGATEYRYDTLGNLLEATLPDGTRVEYVIDGENRRIGRKVDGTFTRGFLYQDGTRPIAEVDGSGAVTGRFVYASRDTVPDYMIRDDTVYRFVTDLRGSPRLVVDASTGEVAQRLEYDEFGNVVADTNPGFQPFGFAGGIYDPDTGLVRFGARDYDPEVGRWTTRDPIGFAGGLNLYAYCGNDPINFVDPSGFGADIHNIPSPENDPEGFRRGVQRRIGQLYKTKAGIPGHLEQVNNQIRRLNQAKERAWKTQNWALYNKLMRVESQIHDSWRKSKHVAKRAGILGTVLLAFDVQTAMAADLNDRCGGFSRTRQIAGAGIGGVVGAGLTGAVAGSIVPGIGTVGGFVVGLAGGLVGSYLGERMASRNGVPRNCTC